MFTCISTDCSIYTILSFFKYEFGNETYRESDTTAMNRVTASTIAGPHRPAGCLPDITKNVSHSGLAPPAATSVARIP